MSTAAAQESRPTVLVASLEGGSRALARDWGRHVAHSLGARVVSPPTGVRTPELLDAAGKCEARWLVVAWDGRRPGQDAARLLRRAPCPVLSVPPWAAEPRRGLRAAVVGVDDSASARATARAVAALLAHGRGARRLTLTRGCSSDPAELAARRPWRELAEAMQPTAHPQLQDLVRELRRAGCGGVELVVRPVWAPTLLTGLAQREAADLLALGVPHRLEAAEASRLPPLVARVLRSTPCPVATCSAYAAPVAPRGETRPPRPPSRGPL